jgi:hypothetical protein
MHLRRARASRLQCPVRVPKRAHIGPLRGSASVQIEPSSRYGIAAGYVSYLRSSEQGATVPEWSDVALTLIKQTPDPLEVLRRFVDRFRSTSMYTGSLASILEGHRLLLEGVLQHRRSEVAAAAAQAIAELNETTESRRT